MQLQPAERPRPSTGVARRFRRPRPSDALSIWTLAGECGLDQNSLYAYLLIGEYFADTSVVAIDPLGDDGDVVGFISGFRCQRDPSTVFVWQVAVSPRHRRRGLAGAMLDCLVEQTGARRVEATVTPSNIPSAALFRALSERHGTSVDETPLFGEELFPDGHEPEIRLRVSLREPPTVSLRETPTRDNTEQEANHAPL